MILRLQGGISGLRATLSYCCLVVDASHFVTSAHARTWRVPTDVPTVQAGIDSAQAGDDVLLAPGSYTWTSEGAVQFSMLTIAKPGLTLHSEAGAGATTLDAEFEGRVLRCLDVGGLVIEGLTFRNGSATLDVPVNTPGTATHGKFGGGIYATGNSQPTIRSCMFVGNSAVGSGANDFGGAINCGMATIDGCTFLDNRAGNNAGNGFGGAIHSAAAVIRNCYFARNISSGDHSAGGGAVMSFGASITDCVFEDNETGAFLGAGGGGVLEADGGSVTRCTFMRNRASASNQGCNSGGLSISRGTVSHCLFIENHARAAFTAVARGGALGCGSTTVSECVFIANRAYHVAPDGPGYGGAIAVGTQASIVTTIRNCTLVGNSGETQGVGGIFFFRGPGAVERSIISGTVGQTCSGVDGWQGIWQCSNLFGNSQGDTICGSDDGSNFTANPQFCAVDPAGSFNIQIQDDSPCAPGNHPDGNPCGLIGAGPVGCGSVSVQNHSWGHIKDLYR